MEIKKIKKLNTTSSKIKKIKNHPLKVVYISNPMKVTTSAADFRALVQRLTGKSAVWPVDLDGPHVGSPADSELSNGNTICDEKNNVSVTNDGVGFPVAEPSPESSVASDDLHFQPHDLDYDDLVLIDFESLIRSDGVDVFSCFFGSS